MTVQKKYLLTVAGAVWLIAGANIVNIGLGAAGGHWTLLMLACSLVIFLLFHNFVFRRMVKKHTRRITSYSEDNQNIFKFFDRSAYIVMFSMITLGVGLRLSHLLPEACIAVFYAGLGFSLVIAGLSFFIRYFCYRKTA